MKKKLLALTVLFVSVLIVPWHDLAAQTNPLFEENFDAVPAKELPGGWTETHESYGWSVITPAKENGRFKGSITSNVMWCDSYYNNEMSSFTTSEFMLPSEPGYVLDFDLLGKIDNSNENELLCVYVVETEAQTPVASGLNGSDDSWTIFENIPLSAFSGKTVKLKFEFKGDYGSYDIAIDNISVKLPPACARPDNLEVMSVTANSATVRWSMPEGVGAIASDFNYIADYGGSEKQTGRITSEKITVADGVYTTIIEGLKPASAYSLQLSGACDGEDSKLSLPVSFSTECAVITDIDDFVRFYDLTKSVYPCWEIGPKSKAPVTSGWSTSLYVTLSDYLKSGPVKKINPIDIEVVVSANGGWNSARLDVDIVYTDEGDQLQNITVGSVACSNEFKDYYFNFTSLTDEQRADIADKEWNVYFKADGNSVKIQSVDIRKRPNYFPVKDVNVSNIGKNSAKLSWKPAEATDTQFAVTYTIGKFGAGEGVTKTETITRQTLDISGLDPLVRYEISGSVVTLNPDNADDKSRPTEFSFVFDTSGDPIEVDETHVWIENFNQGVENSSFYMPVGLNVIGDNNINSNQYFRINGSGVNKSLCMRYYSSSGNDNPHVLVFPEFALTAGQTYRFSFYLSRSKSTPSETAAKENNSVFVYTSATSEIEGLTAVYSVPLFSSMDPVADGSAYRRYSVEFTPSGDNDVKFIILQVKCDDNNGVDVYFDNFELALKPEIETILYPVSADKITHESVVVSVSNDESLTDGTLQAVAVPKGALPTSSDGILSKVSEFTTEVTVSGLAEKTAYDIYLRVVNGEKHSLWSAYYASVTTHCTPMTISDDGYYNNFDDCYVDYKMSVKTGLYETLCYLLPNNNSLNVIDERGMECGTWGNYVMFYPRGEAAEEGGKRCAIGKQFDNKDTRFYKEIFLKAGQGYKMSVYATSLNLEEYLSDSKMTMKMVVGETTDIAENTVFGTFDIPVMLLNTENVNAAWNNQYIGYFKAPQDGIYSVGFSFVVEGFSNGKGVWAIDDWRIDFEDYMPITASVVADPDKATFTFNDGDEGDTYRLRILDREFGKTEIETIGEWVYSSDEMKEFQHIVTDLAENTAYYYAVSRTNGEKTSIWSDPVMFITPCFDSNVTGYTDQFGEMTENEVPACWTALVNNKGVEVVNTNSDNDGFKKSVSVGNGDMVASPRFASTLNGRVLKGKVLSFTAGATFTVGVNKSVEYTEEETPAIETVLYTGTVFTDRVWQDFTVYFVGSTEEELADKANYFVMTANGGDCRFAELKIEDMPACPALVSGTIDYESVTPTSVNVALKSTALTAPNGWYVVAKPKSSEVKEVTTELITVIDDAVTISGLEYVTTYSVYAKVACGEDSNSDEVLLGDITTGCPVETVPYTYTADETKKTMPQCWSVETNDNNKEWMWGNQWVESASAIDVLTQLDVLTEQNAEPHTTLVTAEIAITKTSYAEFTYTIEGPANITVLVIDQNGEEHEMAMFAVNAYNVTKGFLIPEEFIGQNIRVAFRAGMNRGIYGSENEDPMAVKLSGFSIKDEDIPEISEPSLSVTSDDVRFTADGQSGKNNVDFGVIGGSEVLELIFKVKGIGTSDIIISPKENLKSKIEIEPAFVPADGQEHEVKLKVTPDYNDYWYSKEINIVAAGIGSQKVALSWIIASLEIYENNQTCDEETGMCYKELGEIEIGKDVSCEINIYGGEDMSGVIEFTTDNTDAVCTPQQIQFEGSVEDVITLTVTPTKSGAQQAVITATVDRFKFTYTVKWTAVEPVVPEIIVESTSGVIGDDNTVTFDNVKFGSRPEFVLTVSGTDLTGDITVSVSGENSDNVISDKNVVTPSEAESGVEVKFVISADSRDGGSALITFISVGAKDYQIPVVWTVDRSTVGVDNVSSDTDVYSTGGVVYVRALEGSEIAVYSVQGHSIATATAESGLTAINGIDAGVVIISVNGVAHKVVVR